MLTRKVGLVPCAYPCYGTYDDNYLVTEPGEHELPEQELIHTEWFHVDCLADYYKVEVFGEEHWRIISEYMRAAVKSGINMILTPIFTPPLDTAPGGERTTVQLVDVRVQKGSGGAQGNGDDRRREV